MAYTLHNGANKDNFFDGKVKCPAMFLLIMVLVSTVYPTLSQLQICHANSDSGMCPTRDTAHPCSEPDWKRVVFINMTDPNQKNCPLGLHLTTDPIRMCGHNASSDYVCNFTTFSVGGSSYNKCVEGSEAISMDQLSPSCYISTTLVVSP